MILPRHKRVVLWGLRDPTRDSFQHIWRHYAHALDHAAKPYVWVPDEPWCRDALAPGDLVFAVDVAAKHLGRPVDSVDYMLHNITDDHPVRDGLERERHIYLQVWTNDCADRGEAWGPVRRWDRHSRVLYQPWGTDLLADEFYEPVFDGESSVAVFVGSVWDGNGQGNRDAIDELRRVLAKHGLMLDHRSGVDDETNARLVRGSRIAPAVAGQWQVEHEYLPCRVFKNVSYGQLAITNVPKMQEILGIDYEPESPSIEITIDLALNISESDWLEETRRQQEIVRDYTYAQSLEMIERAFDES